MGIAASGQTSGLLEKKHALPLEAHKDYREDNNSQPKEIAASYLGKKSHNSNRMKYGDEASKRSLVLTSDVRENLADSGQVESKAEDEAI